MPVHFFHCTDGFSFFVSVAADPHSDKDR
jgi:hypothetical protein